LLRRDLPRHLEHDELVCPGREPAQSPEFIQLPQHRYHRIARRLLSQIVEFRARDLPELGAATS